MGRGKEYDPVDCKILSLIRQREEAGFPLDYSLDMMAIYRKHIQTIVQEDAKLFAQRLLPNASAREVARYIREGDRALGAFMPLIREKLARANAERIIESMDGAAGPIKEALRFRLVHGDPRNGREPRQGEGPNGAFWAGLLRVLSGRKPPAAAVDPVDEEVAGLLTGLRCLKTGRAEEACLHLRRAGRSKRIGPLATALQGIAHLLKAPQAPGLLAGLQVLKEALGCLQASRQRAPDQDVNLLTSYFRGIGLAVIPDLFNTHGEAARELTHVARPAGTRKQDIESIFREELRLKAAYFLATMYLEDEAYDHAGKVLEGLMKSGADSFYHRWAASQMKGIGKSRAVG
jgi:hypothetical protein